MSERVIYLLASIILLAFPVVTYAQTDIGSQSSAGTVTGNADKATLTRQQRFDRQEAVLRQDLARIPPHVLGNADTEALAEVYRYLGKSGQSVAPVDFLALTIVIMSRPAQELPSKKYEAIKTSLISAGLVSQIATTNEAVITKHDFEQELKKAKLEVTAALQTKR